MKSMDKLNILHIIPSLGKGGAERICVDICQQLDKTGVKVEILILENKIEYPIENLTIKYFDLLGKVSFSKNESDEFSSFTKYV